VPKRKAQSGESPVTAQQEPVTTGLAEHVDDRPMDGARPNPRAWDSNNELSVEYRTRTEPYEAQIAFREKPSQEILDYIKQHGFHWNSQDKAWARPISYGSQEQDRLFGRRAYAEVVKMLRKEKGLATDPEVAFLGMDWLSESARL